jgi:hypothetical protein
VRLKADVRPDIYRHAPDRIHLRRGWRTCSGTLASAIQLWRSVNALAGGAGGILFTWLAAGIPGVGRFVGYVEHAASATVQGVGGLTPAILVGSGIAGLLGGLALTFIGGLVRNAAVD